MPEVISNFRELRVYQLAFEWQQEIFEITKSFPKEERYALSDQLRRASRSVGANIGEAWQKRRYIAHFVSKLTDADGELAETQHWIDTAAACDYITSEVQQQVGAKSRQIGQMIGAMLVHPDKFCAKAR